MSDATKDEKELEQMYQIKTDKQHVLDNPDTYTGSMELTDYNTFIYDDESNKVLNKQLNIIPGLYKLFDECIVNCRDHCTRMKQAQTTGSPDVNLVTNIQVDITEDGTITLTNDGNGVDVAKHPSEHIWIPEMIFGHLRTSTNYDKSQKKITGGKNGFGIKLVFIWSVHAKIETVDSTRKLKYVQEFNDNLNTIKPPIITKCSKKPYTIISFKPDYARLGITGLSQDMLALFKRRVYDIAAITDQTVKVKYNSELVPVRNLQQYVELFIGKGEEPRVYEKVNERWEYIVCLAKDEFTQTSFVNGIFTGKGGKHVEYIMNQIIRKMTVHIKTKKKIDVKPNAIKDQIWIFLRCDIDNPVFESQTKDFMSTSSSAFGSSCEVSDKFIEKIAKIGIMDAACTITEAKETKISKKSDGSKVKSIRGIPKLIDANLAGTNKSSECTLILCEGDSAKAGIVSGLSASDRNIIGVYPLKGKLFNVRGETLKRVMENKEICELKQIIGLETGKSYTAESAKQCLRYNKILFMTDQDLDGSHIKGLGINLFDAQWNTLLEIPGFIGFMNTPIIKAHKGSNELLFYNDGEYDKWKQTDEAKGWKCKYYKGLGTSTGKEFKEYFANKKVVEFISSGEKSRDAIDMAFNKKRVVCRKDWLATYNRNDYLDTDKVNVSYEEFIEKEMIHFSKYDCERAIPNIDGLKTSQRKVLYTCFKRKIVSEIKVAQLSGSVSEISRYHHGEQSLNGTIVNMAQNFVGSNNINLLKPNGQFGTRLQGGDDSASERYIFTELNQMTRHIFKEEDDEILEYLQDDGYSVEPMYYVPIIPLILINGSKGIGTGFSTDILCYNPIEIIDFVTKKIHGIDTSNINILPFYEGFKGEVKDIGKGRYLFRGIYEVISDKQVRITELPVGSWTDDFKQHIEDLMDKDKSPPTPTSATTSSSSKYIPSGIKDYVDMSTDTNVDITITFCTNVVPDMIKSMGENEYETCNSLEKLLKLYTTRSTNNMHVFDENEKLVKFDTIGDLIEHYIKIRIKAYKIRKLHQLEKMSKNVRTLTNKANFIIELLNGTLDLRKKKTEEVSELLKTKKYDLMEDSFNYLTRMPMDSVTDENVEKIISDKKKMNELYDNLTSMKEEQIWLRELSELKERYIEYIGEFRKAGTSVKIKEKSKAKVKGVKA